VSKVVTLKKSYQIAKTLTNR